MGKKRGQGCLARTIHRGTLAGMVGWLPAVGLAWAVHPAPMHYADVAKTPSFMTLRGFLVVDGQVPQEGTEIGVYDPDGVLCGASRIDVANGGAFILHVYGDDPTTPGVDEGAKGGNVLTFDVFDPNGSITWEHGSLGFRVAKTRWLDFDSVPPSHPPLFEERAGYSVKVDAVASCTGDLDADGYVGVGDLMVFAERYGQADWSGPWDLDGDADVDGKDLVEFARDLGRGDCL